ncbi:MAG: peptidase, partial [Gemmatimonadaceae bacterium]
THEIRVSVRNSGRLPTALEQAKRVHMVQPDQLALKMPKGSTTLTVGRTQEFWLAGGEAKTVVLRVRAGEKQIDRDVTVRALSTRGGVAERKVKFNP